MQPHLEAAVEASRPIVKKAMDATEPQRVKAGEVFQVYRGKFDDNVGAPVGEVRLLIRCVFGVWMRACFFAASIGPVRTNVSRRRAKAARTHACVCVRVCVLCCVCMHAFERFERLRGFCRNPGALRGVKPRLRARA